MGTFSKGFSYIAHVRLNDKGEWETQLLADHLNGTARRAGEFASEFGNRDWGELLGYWHDLGKFHPIWQAHIRRENGYDIESHLESLKGKIYHSIHGAILSLSSMKERPPSRILAYGIAGHHGGLPDWYPDEAGGDLTNRVYDVTNEALKLSELDDIKKIPEAEQFINKPIPKTSPLGISSPKEFETREEYFHLWIRMLFSCLVDADYLDTEFFMEPQKFSERGKYLSLPQLKERFDAYIEHKEKDSPTSPINQKRQEIRRQCIEKAALEPGFFSLTVPTGGGKTLSSMAFALNHAIKYNKKRIIVAIPYTSIIEQTAKIFKYGTDNENEINERLEKGEALFGEDQVVEHHSNLDPNRETIWNQLACENWDAPIIVTTNVQLFESLFASSTSSCRKLHNIVNSIIILDEVQMLPPEYLKPILSVLRGLVNHFRVTVLMMSATQPALEGKIGAPPVVVEGIENVKHIIEHSETLAQDFQRVEIHLPKKLDEKSSWERIRDELIEHEQVLCIVNSRRDCRELHALMPEGTVHLSALMCGEERSVVISEIKEKLRNNEPIRVISTQLVEAGVDIDFPVVYRALAGFDSIAQAAGRCNREDKLSQFGQKGKFVVFVPPKPAPPGLLRKGEDTCKEIIRNQEIHSLSPHLFTEYFQKFYQSVNDMDQPQFYDRLVREAREFKFQFRTLAQNFHLIDNQMYQSIVVKYENPKNGNNSIKLIDDLRRKGMDRLFIQKLQRFLVNVPTPLVMQLLELDYIEEVFGIYVQKFDGLYKNGIGLQIDNPLLHENLVF